MEFSASGTEFVTRDMFSRAAGAGRLTCESVRHEAETGDWVAVSESQPCEG